MVGVATAVFAMQVGIVGAAGPPRAAEPYATFDPAAKQFPEGIAVDPQGNIYTSMNSLSEIWRLDSSGGHSLFTKFNVPGKGPAGLAMAADGTMYSAVAALDLATGQSDPATRGVYRVAPDGTNERLPGSDGMVFPNDLKLDERGNLYITDATAGEVWRIPPGGKAEVWAKDPLLAGNGRFNFGFPIGANGIAVDGIALDANGNIYAASAVLWTVVRITPDGSSIETLATASDGLNQPSTLAFGTTANDRTTLYIANQSSFSPTPNPGVMKLEASVPGQPLP